MHELQKYIATIQNGDRDQFDSVLSKISHRSGVRPGSRLSSIIPMAEKTVYEVSLNEEEAVVLALACPGEYIYYNDSYINDAISDFMHQVSK